MRELMQHRSHPAAEVIGLHDRDALAGGRIPASRSVPRLGRGRDTEAFSLRDLNQRLEQPWIGYSDGRQLELRKFAALRLRHVEDVRNAEASHDRLDFPDVILDHPN